MLMYTSVHMYRMIYTSVYVYRNQIYTSVYVYRKWSREKKRERL